MNWKAEAVEKLRKYDAVRRAMVNIPAELDRLQAEYTAIGGANPERLPGKRDVRKGEDRLLNNLVCRQEMEFSLAQAKMWMDTVSRALAALEPEERLVLHRLYIDPQKGSMEQLCQELQVEKSSIYRRRDRGLEKFTLAMYGATESN